MIERWVVPWLFNVQAARVDWGQEQERLRYDGPVLQTGFDPALVQLRWLLHPVLGQPLEPFMVWRRKQPGGSATPQEMANLPGWEPVEIVGLPVDDSWANSQYLLDGQGPVGNRMDPREAALRRLQLGAPRIGWPQLTSGALSLPPWEPCDLNDYLKELLQGRLLRGIRTMLTENPDPLAHAAFVEREVEPANLRRLKPRLFGTDASAGAAIEQPSRAEWHPLGLLALSAGSDPLASLALGFGTALFDNEGDMYMVSVRHRLTIANQEFEFELAGVVTMNSQALAPKAPTGLSATLLNRNRPLVLDGPGSDSVGVRWTRPLNPAFSAQPPTAAYPSSFAVGRFGPGPHDAQILLTRRPEPLTGWLPFVPSQPAEAQPVLFNDHLNRATIVSGEVVADPVPMLATYAVAAQDIFGRWSTWRTTGYNATGEAPQAPSILAVQLDPSGELTVDFSWDWSNRSPEFMELTAAFEDDPANRLFTARLQFGGDIQPETAGKQVIPLTPGRAESTGWGTPQDAGQPEPGVRYYRLSTTVPLSFGGKRSRTLLVQARGQCHVHQVKIPNWNVSAFGPPKKAMIYDPAPPPPPRVPEAPQWASLPDVAGVSRAVLSWSGDPSVAGYALYEVTETALLAALGRPGPDTAQPFTDRLAVLRYANLPALRSSFRRVRDDLIPPGTPMTSFEVALPRGSAVLHLYAVTAFSHNQQESAWPSNSKQFIAVAAPRLAVPDAPALEANPTSVNGQPAVNLRIMVGAGSPVKQIELYRTRDELLAASVDTMGPPIVTLNVTGAELAFTDTTMTPGWRRIWYRAVAWSADDDLKGLVAARSPSSAKISVLLPPQTAPAVADLRVNEPGSTQSESLVSWSSNAPVPVTPLGPHTAALEATDGTGNFTLHLSGRLDTMPFFNSLADLPPANPADRKIIRVGVPGTPPYRFFSWVPRPAPDQAFQVTAKMIDPLGRIGRFTADVPPLPIPSTPINIVEVRAPGINTVFDPSGSLVVNDSTAAIRLPGTGGEGFLQTRLAPPGVAGTPGAGFRPYLYRINLGGISGDPSTQGVAAVRLPVADLARLDYAGTGRPAELFVISAGGIGIRAPRSARREGHAIVLTFDPPLRVGSAAAAGESSFFIGLAAAGPPQPGTSQLLDRQGHVIEVACRVPSTN
ncbi:hypothetical protein [Nitrolancea hollandica]|uniref:Uncharacterized protein n=1 Tax=Nitrolancea hollandica Lb TaxID=1129897 RepID=I4ELU0_9BACT|nr:hypothetical protein [Nitrolancea hollandica]CCF85652.1 hypothetical protein NITHO_530010 [Nitrolancea hollandica Lb]